METNQEFLFCAKTVFQVVERLPMVTGKSLVPKPLYVQYVTEMSFSNILNCCSTTDVWVNGYSIHCRVLCVLYYDLKPLSNLLPPDLLSCPNQNQYFSNLSTSSHPLSI